MKIVPDKARSAQLAAARQALLKKKLQQSSKRAEVSVSTIPRRAAGAALPLSSGQMRLWYLSQFEDGLAIHNIVTALKLSGNLDKSKLQAAINSIIKRHEALRMYFSTSMTSKEHIELVVDNNFCINLDTINLNDAYRVRGQQLIEETIRDLSLLPFDLQAAPLIRIHCLDLEPQLHIIVITVNHAVFDGVSLNIFLNEMFKFYTNADEAADAIPLPLLQYGDYCIWHQDFIRSANLQRQLDYWIQHLDGELPQLNLPLDQPRKPQQSFAGDSQSILLEPELLTRLELLARNHNSTLFMLMLSAFYSLLHRYTGQRDFIVGTPIAGRTLPDLQDSIGYFVNTLPLRARINENDTFAELLQQVTSSCLSAFENQDVPFELLVEKIKPPRDLSRTPLYQAFFGFQLYEDINTGDDCLKCERLPMGTYLSRTDLSLWHERDESGMHVCAEYCSELFDPATIKGLLRHYRTLLQAVLKHSELSPTLLPMLSSEDYQRLAASNQTSAHNPATSFIDQLQLSRTNHAQKTAVISGTEALTFEQLDKRSSQLAHHLRSEGVAQGDYVGLFINRNINMLVAALAIWKTGAAYIPLDATYPQQRLRYMLETAAVPVLVTDSALANIVSEYPCRRICIDTEQADIAAHSELAPAFTIDPEAIAYVIFTSGSTGNPKGVQVPHRAVMNFLHSMASEPGLAHDDVLLAVTTLSFDIAVLELYLPLLVGATVVIADSEQAADAEQLKNLISQHQVTTMQATPSTWRLLLAAGWQGNDDFKALCGGEAFPQDLADKLLSKAGQVWNMYGPTETTVWSTCYRLQNGSEPVYIGHPIANTQCYVLDERCQRVPIGVAGELYIGGDGVTSGYLARPDLTAERFVDNPYRDEPGASLYRTGDQVRWRQDGRLEYFRRMDDQVKLRGFRIELGEIESVLTGNPHIAQAAALLRSYGTTDQRLVAYIYFEDGASLTNTELRRYLRNHLPHYMIPQLFMELDRMPLTPNGKVDRKALPEPLQAVNQTRQYQAPGTETETQIASIWREVLGVEEFDVDQNFFDVGGHSLLALDVIYRIEAGLGVKITALDILLNSLGQIAAQIDQRRIPEAGTALDANHRASTGGNGIIRRLFTKKRRN